MSDIAPVIEMFEHRWMRAWINGDIKTMKAITSKDFILLAASKPPSILDRPSWLEAAAKRYLASSYRFGDILVRAHGKVAVFAAPLELRATMDGHDWSGTMFVTDLWRRGRIRGGWKLVQRVASKADENSELPKAIRSLQLWR